MTQDLFPQPWLINTLLDEGFIAQKRAELAQAPVPNGLQAWMDANFDATKLSQRNEEQLEKRFIGPLLTAICESKALGQTRLQPEPDLIPSAACPAR